MMTAQQLRTQRILWGALLVSTLVYLGIGLGIELAPPTPPPPAVLPLALAVAALGTAVMSLVVPERMARERLLALSLPVVERAAEETMFADGVRQRRRFADPATALRRAQPVGQVALILELALAESIAIEGFLLLLLRFPAAIAAPFFLLAWALMLARFPTAARLGARLERAYSADLAPAESDR
jgi:hypothetical protein